MGVPYRHRSLFAHGLIRKSGNFFGAMRRGHPHFVGEGEIGRISPLGVLRRIPSKIPSSNHRYRVDLDEVARGHDRDPDYHIRWFVISEQRNLRVFDDRNVLIAVIIDNVDCDLANLLRPCTCCTERSAEIAKCQARLRRKITMPNELAACVFGLLA